MVHKCLCFGPAFIIDDDANFVLYLGWVGEGGKTGESGLVGIDLY